MQRTGRAMSAVCIGMLAILWAAPTFAQSSTFGGVYYRGVFGPRILGQPIYGHSASGNYLNQGVVGGGFYGNPWAQSAWSWTPQPALVVGPTDVISTAGLPTVQPVINPPGVATQTQQQRGVMWFRSGTGIPGQ
jgi:hypothetical protein